MLSILQVFFSLSQEEHTQTEEKQMILMILKWALESRS